MQKRLAAICVMLKHRRHPYSVLVTVAILLGACSTASAGLWVLPPDDLVQQAAAIVVGTVASRIETERSLDVVITVDRVLKGSAKDRRVAVSAWAYPARAKPPDAFPKEGTTVIVALGGDDGDWYLQSDLNAVALVEKEHVTGIYRGGSGVTLNEQTWEAEDYAKAFEELYQAHRPWYSRLAEWIGRLLRLAR